MFLNYNGQLLKAEKGIIEGDKNHTYKIDRTLPKAVRYHKGLSGKTYQYRNSMVTIYFHDRPEGSGELYDGLKFVPINA